MNLKAIGRNLLKMIAAGGVVSVAVGFISTLLIYFSIDKNDPTDQGGWLFLFVPIVMFWAFLVGMLISGIVLLIRYLHRQRT